MIKLCEGPWHSDISPRNHIIAIWICTAVYVFLDVAWSVHFLFFSNFEISEM